jgi:serine/threonine protein kinase
MEYIDGCSLGEVLEKRGVFTEEEATRIIRAAAEALAHVHSTNRLHLDIKPGNIPIMSIAFIMGFLALNFIRENA